MQGKTGGDDDDTSATDTSDIEEAGTRATMVRRGRTDKSSASANRRGVEQRWENKNKGKKHKSLIRKTGGRGNTV